MQAYLRERCVRAQKSFHCASFCHFATPCTGGRNAVQVVELLAHPLITLRSLVDAVFGGDAHQHRCC
jgi:hypothetical protein